MIIIHCTVLFFYWLKPYTFLRACTIFNRNSNLYSLLDGARDISAVFSVKLQIGGKFYKVNNVTNFHLFLIFVCFICYCHGMNNKTIVQFDSTSSNNC